MNLAEFVVAHTERGECKCGECFDRGDRAEPSGHTVEVAFFKVALRADESRATLADRLSSLTRAHAGEFAECDPLDGREHSYLELGAWIGDQGIALLYMALGALVGAFELLTPRSLFGSTIDAALEMQMAGAGLVTIRAKDAVNAD